MSEDDTTFDAVYPPDLDPEPSIPPEQIVTLPYTNWRGETAVRAFQPVELWFGSDEWHPEPQWLLTAIDMEKSALRDFALAGFEKAAQSSCAAREDEALVEAVARAMCRQDHADWDAPDLGYTANGQSPEDQRAYWRDMARVAIRAHDAAAPREGWRSAATLPNDGRAFVAVGAYSAYTKAFLQWDIWFADLSGDHDSEDEESGWRISDANWWMPASFPPAPQPATPEPQP